MNSLSTRWKVFVPSCDAYSDLWPIFFHFLFKYWPSVPTPIYLVSNFRKYNDPRVVTIPIGKERTWAANVYLALQHVTEEYLVSVLDDFLLDQPVPENWVPQIFDQLIDRQGAFVNLFHHDETGEKIEGTHFRQVTPVNGFGNFHTALWKKSVLEELCSHGDNIWRTEWRIRRRVEADQGGFYYISPDAPFHFSYVESVRGGFWKDTSIPFLAQHGIRPDLSKRPCPVQGQDAFSKLQRSLLKRWMHARIRLEAMLKLEPVVQPLKLS